MKIHDCVFIQKNVKGGKEGLEITRSFTNNDTTKTCSTPSHSKLLNFIDTDRLSMKLLSLMPVRPVFDLLKMLDGS